jgi:hypothetical protein
MADRQISTADPDELFRKLSASVSGTPIRDIFVGVLEHLLMVRKTGKAGYICWDLIDRFIKVTAMQAAESCSDPSKGYF